MSYKSEKQSKQSSDIYMTKNLYPEYKKTSKNQYAKHIQPNKKKQAKVEQAFYKKEISKYPINT